MGFVSVEEEVFHCFDCHQMHEWRDGQDHYYYDEAHQKSIAVGWRKTTDLEELIGKHGAERVRQAIKNLCDRGRLFLENEYPLRVRFPLPGEQVGRLLAWIGKEPRRWDDETIAYAVERMHFDKAWLLRALLDLAAANKITFVDGNMTAAAKAEPGASPALTGWSNRGA
jgi:hypothetical protein